jgi:hypothetical protein
MASRNRDSLRAARGQRRTSTLDESYKKCVVPHIDTELPKNTHNITSQESIIEQFTAFNLRICRERGWPDEQAKRAAIRQTRELLGNHFEPSTSVPETPPVSYGRDPDEPGDPVEFLDRHWGKHLDEGVLDKCTLEKLDRKLFSALKWWAQSRKLPLRCAFNPQERPRPNETTPPPHPFPHFPPAIAGMSAPAFGTA